MGHLWFGRSARFSHQLQLLFESIADEGPQGNISGFRMSKNAFSKRGVSSPKIEKFAFAVADCAYRGRSPSRSYSSGHYVCQMCPQDTYQYNSHSFCVGPTTVYHSSDSMWPPCFATLPTFCASRAPATEPLATISAALLQLCSSDCLLQSCAICVGYCVTNYTYEYNLQQQPLTLRRSVQSTLNSWHFV